MWCEGVKRRSLCRWKPTTVSSAKRACRVCLTCVTRVFLPCCHRVFVCCILFYSGYRTTNRTRLVQHTSHRAREQRVHLILHLLWVMQQVLLLVMQRKRQRRITTYHSNRPFSLLPHRLVFLHHSLHHLHDLTLHHRGRHIHHKLRGHQLCVQRVPFLPLTHTHHHHLKHALDDLALLRLDSLTVYQFWVYRITRQCG